MWSVTELLVFCHLPWDFVWQRPQQIVSRLAARWDVTFFEGPVVGDTTEPRLRTARADGVTRVWLEVPAALRHGGRWERAYRDALRDRRHPAGAVAWLYMPLATDTALDLDPAVVVYDVMDDLAAFPHAAPGLAEAHRRLLGVADVVFTGGRSLYRRVHALGRADAHLFRSGVDVAHFRGAHRPVRPGEPRVACYIGVVDERLDFHLLDRLARLLPDWRIRLVGPAGRYLDRAHLPSAPNIEFLGQRPYDELPELLAATDVGIMPFAVNRGTRALSPTKALEYLAAGLPIVSTSLPDVTEDYAGLGEWVTVADGAAAFAAACRAAAGRAVWPDPRVDGFLAGRDWTAIASAMEQVVLRRLGSPDDAAHEA